MIQKGFCECGCGEKTSIAKRINKKLGWIKGQPIRFIFGHHSKGNNNRNWKGGQTINQAGYKLIRNPHHPRACKNGYVYYHILMAERFLGKSLPAGVVIHHPFKNLNGNIVICQDQSYHLRLHKRERALLSCGYADWIKCIFCKTWDRPEKMWKGKNFHLLCKGIYNKNHQ